jgi:hypothetical protein
MYGKQFSSEYQPPAQIRSERNKKGNETRRKKRTLAQLLNLALEGDAGEKLKQGIKDLLGVEIFTIEEGLHISQIVKAIADKDTSAYRVIVETAGIMAPTKFANTDVKGNDIKEENLSSLTEEELIQLHNLHAKLSKS